MGALGEVGVDGDEGVGVGGVQGAGEGGYFGEDVLMVE